MAPKLFLSIPMTLDIIAIIALSKISLTLWLCMEITLLLSNSVGAISNVTMSYKNVKLCHTKIYQIQC